MDNANQTIIQRRLYRIDNPENKHHFLGATWQSVAFQLLRRNRECASKQAHSIKRHAKDVTKNKFAFNASQLALNEAISNASTSIMSIERLKDPIRSSTSKCTVKNSLKLIVMSKILGCSLVFTNQK
jgi:gamma-glutamyl phosphate reductase